MVKSPRFGFIQFGVISPDACCIALPVSGISDLAFYVYVDFKFRVGVRNSTGGVFWDADATQYDWFGSCVNGEDLMLDLSAILKCGECFNLVLSDSDGRVKAVSNMFQYVCDTEYTSVVKYLLNGPGFEWDCPACLNSVRLPLYLTEPQYPQEQEVYKLKGGYRRHLFAEIDKSWVLKTDFMPDELHRKLVIALSHDEVYINDVLLTKSEAYNIDWGNTETINGVKYAMASAGMIENVTARNDNCGECSVEGDACDFEWLDADAVCQLEPENVTETIEFAEYVCQEKEYIPLYTYMDFFNIPRTANPKNLPFFLMNDLDFTGVPGAFIEIDCAVKIYGQGYTIKNWKSNETFISGQDNAGYEAELHDIVFKDISYFTFLDYYALKIERCKFINVYIYGDHRVLIRCGQIECCTFENCKMDASAGAAAFNAAELLMTESAKPATNLIFRNCEVLGGYAGYVLRGIEKAIAINCINTCTSSGSNSSIFCGYQSPLSYPIRSCVAINCDLPTSNKPRFRISAMSDVSDCYSTAMPSFIPATEGGNQGTTITDMQAKDQTFYEELGFDFAGGTWKMGDDGYPDLVIKPEMIFSGLAFAESATYKRYLNEELEAEITKSLLTDVEPELTEDEYKILSVSDVEERAEAVVFLFDVETEPEYLTEPIIEDSTCLPSPPVPTGEWIGTTMPSSQAWNSVAFGNGIFVAVAYNGKCAYSYNGIDWTEVTTPSAKSWISVVFANGKFVAVSYYGDKAAYSENGIDWMESTLPSVQEWISVAYGNGRFVAVAWNSSEAAYSGNGVDWMMVTTPFYSMAVTFGNGKFVIKQSGATDAVAYSDNVIDWTEMTMPSARVWKGLSYVDGVFVAIASNNSNAVAYSTDGIYWTESVSTLPSFADWSSVAYGNGKFVTVASSSNKSAYLIIE